MMGGTFLRRVRIARLRARAAYLEWALRDIGRSAAPHHDERLVLRLLAGTRLEILQLQVSVARSTR